MNLENENMVLKEPAPVYGSNDNDIDLPLLKLSLSMTPWERMQANDDAVNFAESLRLAMGKRHAKLK